MLGKFQRSRRKVLNAKTPFKAVLGDANNQPLAGNGQYWVRPYDAANENNIATPGIPYRVRAGSAVIVPRGGRVVWIGYGYDRKLTVLGYDHDDLIAAGINPTAIQPNSEYRQWLRLKDIQNFRALPIGTGTSPSLKVQVRQLVYYTNDGDLVLWNGTNASTHIDLTAYVPPDGYQRYVIVWLRAYNPNGLSDIQVTYSTPISSINSVLSFTDLQECANQADADAIPDQAYRLANGQTSLSIDDTIDLDLIQFVNMPQIWGFPNTVSRAFRVHEDFSVVAPSAVNVESGGLVQIQDNAQLMILSEGGDTGGGTDTGITQLTGDVTAGPGSGSQAATLATVNTNVGSFTYGSFTVNDKGLIVAASSGTAPVTSVGASSPLSSSGGITPTISFSTQNANIILAGPSTGSAAAPTFRALVDADIPNLDTSKLTTGLMALARGGTHTDTSATGGANQFWKQLTAGGDITVAGITSADLTTALTTPPTIGGTTPSTGTFTTLTGTLIGAGQTTPIAKVDIAGSSSFASWTTTGRNLAVEDNTLTDTSGSGTIAKRVINSFGIPTLISSSSETLTLSANVWIAGAPVASTNVTQTKAAALLVEPGVNTSIAQIWRAASGATSSTANIAEIQSNSGGILTAIKGNGRWDIGNVASGGTVLNAFGSGSGTPVTFQHNSAASGNSVLQMNGGPMTGTHYGLYAALEASQDAVFRIQNASTTGGASATFSMLLTGAGNTTGDARMSFAINGGPSWTIGLDQSDSSSWKLSSGGSLGGNDRLVVVSTGAATHYTEDAVTNALTTVMTVGHNTTGTAAANFGSTLLFNLESSTTADQNAAALDVYWSTATHASRASQLDLSAYYTTTKQVGLSILGDTGGVKLAFFGGSTPVARPSGANQAAVDTTAATNIAPYGYTTQAQADAAITLQNAIRQALIDLNLWKGSA